MDHLLENNILDSSSHLNEGFVLNMVELFPYRDTFEPPLLQAFVCIQQSIGLVHRVPYVDFVIVFVNELHRSSLLEVPYSYLLKRKNRLLGQIRCLGMIFRFGCRYMVGIII